MGETREHLRAVAEKHGFSIKSGGPRDHIALLEGHGHTVETVLSGDPIAIVELQQPDLTGHFTISMSGRDVAKLTGMSGEVAGSYPATVYTSNTGGEPVTPQPMGCWADAWVDGKIIYITYQCTGRFVVIITILPA